MGAGNSVPSRKGGWILWMAAVKEERGRSKPGLFMCGRPAAFWSVEELIPEGRVSKWETVKW